MKYMKMTVSDVSKVSLTMEESKVFIIHQARMIEHLRFSTRLYQALALTLMIMFTVAIGVLILINGLLLL